VPSQLDFTAKPMLCQAVSPPSFFSVSSRRIGWLSLCRGHWDRCLFNEISRLTLFSTSRPLNCTSPPLFLMCTVTFTLLQVLRLHRFSRPRVFPPQKSLYGQPRRNVFLPTNDKIPHACNLVTVSLRPSHHRQLGQVDGSRYRLSRVHTPG
jgi:hypothetical protein